MEPEWNGAHDEVAARLWREVLRPAAARLRSEVPALSVTVVEAIARELPDLLDSPEDIEANRASIEASVRLFADILEDGVDPAESTRLEPATVAYAQDGARQGIALTTLFRSYRLGHAGTARHLTAILNEDVAEPTDLSRAIDLASDWLFGYVDAALCQVEEVYVDERDRWLRSSAADQAEALETLLAGRPIDQDSASRRLRHELHRNHVAVVAWLERHEDGRDTLALLDAAVRDVANALGSKQVLVHTLGTLSVAAWVSTRTSPSEQKLDGIRLRSAAPDGVRVAFGEPAVGVTGFRASHQEALLAQRVARATQQPGGSVTRYRDVALQALGSVDPVQCRSFVAHELGGLFSDDEGVRRLALTVRTFLEENRSRSRTGSRLNVHENTVSYRLRQAEELLGHPIAERSLELGAALALADLCRTDGDAGRD